MKKFLETFENTNITKMMSVYPEYNLLFKELDELEETIKTGVSKQVEIEYYDLIDSLDTFLFKPESIKKYNQTFPNNTLNTELLNETLDFTEDEAKVMLEGEIQELMKDIDKDLISHQTQTQERKSKKRVIEVPDQIITRDMLDIEQEYYGTNFIYEQFKDEDFFKALAMMQTGCKFSTTTYGAKSFVLFRLSETARLIIETSEERQQLDSIFGSGPLNAYILENTKEGLDVVFSILKDAFDIDEDTIRNLDDEFLFNQPIIIGAYQEGLLYKEANKFAQRSELINREKLIKTYFSTYLPLEKICVLTMCNEVHLKSSDDTVAKEQIQLNLNSKVLELEGVSAVPHSASVLKELQEQNLLDDIYKPTPFAQGILSFNATKSRKLQPALRPNMYYRVNLQEDFTKAKSTYYSVYNGQTLYHTNDDVDKTNFALTIPNKLKTNWNIENAKQVDIFPQEWQSNQNFKTYSQYLPFASGGNLSIKKQGIDEKQRTGKENTIIFRDLERNNLWIASTNNPYFVWGINSLHYNFVQTMYSDRKIRIIGNNEPSFTDEDIVFFQLIDENNKILAVLKPLFRKTAAPKMINVDMMGNPIKHYTREDLKSEIDMIENELVGTENPQDIENLEAEIENLEEDMREGRYITEEEKKAKDAQLTIDYTYNWETINSSRTPAPIWDFEELYSELKSMAPDMTNDGIELGTAVGLSESIAKTNTPVIPPEEDLIIDLDEEEEFELIKEKEPEPKVNPTAKPKKKKQSKDELLEDIESDMSYFSRRVDADQSELRVEDDRVVFETRYLGNWSLPEDVDEDDEDSQDYDWEKWDDYTKYYKIFKDWGKDQKWYKKVNLDLDVSEKNWVSFSVILKK
tara:strand:- start:1660 stop:4239 length:2580 start_codon:yes stop_codon:yes gene_type:complete